MSTQKQIRELTDHFKSARRIDTLEKQRNVGMALTTTGALGFVGSIYYRFSTSDYQKMEGAFHAFPYSKQTKDVHYLGSDNPLAQIVNTAIDHQAPARQTQRRDFNDGQFQLYSLDASTKKIDLDKLNSEIKAEGQSALNNFFMPTYAIGGGTVLLTLTGAFLLARTKKQIDHMHKKFILPKTEATETPVPQLEAAP